MNQMKFKKLLIAAFLLVAFQTQAQEAVVTSGGNASGTNGNVSYTVGQVLYTSNTGTTGSVAQGVQQPFEIQTVLGLDNFNVSLELSVYPNPTTETITIERISEMTIDYAITDMTGRVVATGKIDSLQSEVNVSQLETGSYQFLIEGSKPSTFVKTK